MWYYIKYCINTIYMTFSDIWGSAVFQTVFSTFKKDNSNNLKCRIKVQYNMTEFCHGSVILLHVQLVTPNSSRMIPIFAYLQFV